MGAEDTAFGAILEIPDTALNKIKEADEKIKVLAQTSLKAANEIKQHWQTIAVEGMDAFIAKINAANTALSGIKMPTKASFDLNVKTSDASAIGAIAAEVSKLAVNLQALSDSTTNWQRSMTSSSAVVADYAVKLRDLAKAIEESKTAEAMTKENASLKLAKAEYREIIEAIDNAMAAQRKFIELYNNPSTSADTKSRLTAQYLEAQASIEALQRRRVELENEHGDKLKAIAAQNAKKQADAEMAEHKKAEREKAKATEDAEKRRSAAVIRAARERAAQETALNRQATRQRADDAAANKERRLADAYNQVVEAIKRTRAEIDALNKTDKNYQQEVTRLNAQLNEQLRILNRLSSGSRTLSVEHEKTRRVISKLRDVAFAYFSLSSITGYIKKMVEVRAQFEMQQVALRAILQNKDEADRIFMQVQQMAMQSPFTIMQLTTYTKQLAAYRIEANKLVGTTKMLADVSAGLAVDIQRLILAYGQVKSANYLRATEIRQFTEAGLNIAGELANYFSELQGRMVSVGEVMDMVTKRMVRFEDVEEVFKRVTSASGLFYDMQRKQSETIAGQMQRIGDAYSIMLNEIGMANQGTIVSILATIREWISNWREIAAEIKSAAFAMAAFMAVTKTMRFIGATTIMEVGTGFKMLGQQIMTSVRGVNLLKFALKGIASTTGIGLIIAVLTEFAARAMFATDAMEQLNEELGRIGGESLKEMQDAIGSFVQLANTISDATKTYTEHQEALDELKRRYKDILPEHKMQSEYIKSLNGDYRELTNTITQYYQSQEYQKKIEAVMGSDAYKDATKELKETGESLLKDGLFDAYVTKSQVDAWMQTIADEIAQGKILNTTDAIAARIKEAFGTSLKGTQTAVAAYLSPVQEKFAELQETIDGLSISTADARDYLESVSQSLSNQSTAQLNKGMIDLQKRREELEHQIAMQYRMADAEYNTTNQRRQAAAQAVELREELKRLESQQETYNRVMAERVIEKYTANIKDLTAKINSQIAAYYELNKKLQTYRADGRLNAEMESELTDKMNESYVSAKKLAYAYGVTLERETLDAIDSQHKLSATMQELTAMTFPKLKLAAMDSLSAVERQMLNAGTSVDILRKAMQQLGSAMGIDFAQDLNTATAALDKELEAAQAVRNEIAQKHGVFAFDLDIERAGDESTKAYADRLRKSAEQDAQTVKDYQAAVEKGYADTDEVANGYSKEEIERLDKLSKAREEYANKLYYHAEKEKNTGGKDLVAELWKNRLKAIQDFYKRYEELRKKFNEAESQKQLKESFRELFEQVELDMSTIMARGMDKKGFAENLNVLLQAVKAVRPKLADEFAKAFADVDIQVRFEFQDKQKEDFKKKVEEAFASLNLSQEFQKLGLPGDLTNLFGVGPINNLKQLRKEIEFWHEKFVDAGKLGTEGEQVYKDAIKKLTEMERKNQDERAKNYYKYLLESYSKGAQIQLKAQQEVNKIMASEQYDEWTKQEAKRNIMLKAQADQQKQMLQEFQGSDLYVDIFADLKSASEENLNYVIEKLREFKESFKDMPADQVRAIIKQIESAETALSEKNLFGDFSSNVRDMIKYFKTRKQLEANLRTETTKQANIRKQRDEESVKLDKLTKYRDTLKKGTKEWLVANAAVLVQQNLINGLNKDLEESEDKAKGFADGLTKGQRATNAVRGALKGFRDNMSSISNALGDLSEGLDSMGLMSDGMRDTFDSLQDVMAGIDTAVEGLESIDFTRPMTIITGLAQTIGGIFQTIGGFFGMTDKKKERQIKRLRDKVEDLDRAYQKLENTMERVYAFEDYVYGSKQLEQNLRQQLNSYEQMLELEKSKKKSDTATIREFEDAIEDLKQQLQDLADERTKALGGIGKNEWAEAAEEFMDVWFDAFKEQGDGLDALNDKWNDYLKNLIVKQATMRIVSKRLSGLFDMVDRAVSATSEQGEKLTRAELDELNKKRLEIMASLNGELKDLMEAWGIAGGQGELLLSDLQKGISNITEAQAAAIEAYLNSIRFAVYEHTNQLNQMLELLRAQYGTNDNSPMLAELRNIKNILSTISDNLNSVITYDNGQRKLRVR